MAADNPYNDYTVQAPAIGSGNGATALRRPRAAGTPTQPIDYARVPRRTRVTPRQNDVEYATDGVSWSTFQTVGGVKTAQAKITDHHV